ncbi:hypothetical protein [Paludibaculum fermentans]|uniref:Uncharacterized protein n=1 Tax=Paludibaculum fermentans TaxID=1473598 RepID=A0A7S7NWM0_PALFE|nr:hypothetical protein [Paludibaculum fermentans]QOY91145.1 hypothetical protein IRI77_14715 [Paludibaculum fermentans]
MRKYLTFRMVWRVNALLIFIAGTGACTTLCFSAWTLLFGSQAAYRANGAVQVEGSGEERWWFGRFETVAGSGYVVAPVSSMQPYKVGSIGKQDSAVRNYLFVQLADKSSRWLMPHNKGLIVSMERYGADGLIPGFESEKRPIKWLVFQVVPADTNGDKSVTSEDRLVFGVANADGSHYVEVVKDIDGVLGSTWVAGDRLVLFYARGGKNMVSEIDFAGRSVVSTKELPKIGT